MPADALLSPMSLLAPLQHELDLNRHAGEQPPDGPVPRPQVGSPLELDLAVLEGMVRPSVYRSLGIS